MNMHLYYKRYSDYAIVYIEGGIEAYDQNSFMKPFVELDTIKCYNYILNFEQTRFLSSSIIGSLIQVWKTANEHGGELVICSPNKTVERIFEVTNLRSKIRIFESEREAQLIFSRSEKNREENGGSGRS
ncbi:STAS domain-containing protein [bacterium]|nr:STAS domain-containing protein [bacterium]